MGTRHYEQPVSLRHPSSLEYTGWKTDNNSEARYESHSRMLQNHCSNENRDRPTTSMDPTLSQDLSCNHANAVTLYETSNTTMANKRPTNKNFLYPIQIESRKYAATIPPHVHNNRDNRDT
jgi:hypothetical protein